MDPLGDTQLFGTTMPGTYIGSPVVMDTILSWTPGGNTIIHDVYTSRDNEDRAHITGLYGTNIDPNFQDPNSAHPELLIPGRIKNVNSESRVVSGWAKAGVMVRDNFGDDLAVFSYNENTYDSLGGLMTWGGYAAIEDFGGMLDVGVQDFFVPDPLDTTYSRGVATITPNIAGITVYDGSNHKYNLWTLDFNNPDPLGNPTIANPGTFIDVNDPNDLHAVSPVGVDDYAFSRSTPQEGGFLTGYTDDGTWLLQAYDLRGNALDHTLESQVVVGGGRSIRDHQALYVDDIMLYAAIEGKSDNNKVFLFYWDLQEQKKEQR